MSRLFAESRYPLLCPLRCSFVHSFPGISLAGDRLLVFTGNLDIEDASSDKLIQLSIMQVRSVSSLRTKGC